MGTGENEQALQKVIDFIRLISVIILLIHYYSFCYAAWDVQGLTYSIADKVLDGLRLTGIFNGALTAKLCSLGLLIVSLIGSRGRKDSKVGFGVAFAQAMLGVVILLLGQHIFLLNSDIVALSGIYVVGTSIGFLLVLGGGTLISRVLNVDLKSDIFNKLNETFPQEERLLENEYSINLPAEYIIRGKRRRSWINVINPFRSVLVIGTPGAGKSYFVIRHIISQHIRKGFTMFIYDFKFDDLSRIAYNVLLKSGARYQTCPRFFVINFEDLSRTHRCNPLDPATMDDITDATESSRTIMLG
ncbi:MAG TPA: YWFCY domain-containing protein, partial [Cyclobacteriaceae bacterium]|nr:YWFCY domain-containing protein [Cyclobacteriaceae bacterium]